MDSLYFLVFFLCYSVLQINAYGSGPPPAACAANLPQHFSIGAQYNNVGLTLNHSANTVSVLEPIIFTLFLPNADLNPNPSNSDDCINCFKGFFIDAIASLKGIPQRVGTWTLLDSIPANAPITDQFCGDKSAIGHGSRTFKSMMKFEWMPPMVYDDAYTSDVQFRWTVVGNNYTMIYSNLQDSKLNFPHTPNHAPPLTPSLAVTKAVTDETQNSTITLSWDSTFGGSTEVVKYILQELTSMKNYTFEASDTAVSLSNFKPGIQYHFTIIAINRNQLSSPAGFASVLTPPSNAKDLVVIGPSIYTVTSTGRLFIKILESESIGPLQTLSYTAIYGTNPDPTKNTQTVVLNLDDQGTGIIEPVAAATNYYVQLQLYLTGDITLYSTNIGHNYTTWCNIPPNTKAPNYTDGGCSNNGICMVRPGLLDFPPQCHCNEGMLGLDCSMQSIQGPTCVSGDYCMYLTHVMDSKHPTELSFAMVYFRIRVYTRGWFALLFNTIDGMANGLGYRFTVDQYNFTSVAAMYAKEKGAPEDLQLDSGFDISVFSGFSDLEQTYTDIQFSRTIVPTSNDEANFMGLSDSNATDTQVSWAWGPAEFEKHAPGNYGQVHINFMMNKIMMPDKIDYFKVYLFPLAIGLGSIIIISIFFQVSSLRTSSLGKLIMEVRIFPTTLTPGYGTSPYQDCWKYFDLFTLDFRHFISDLIIFEIGLIGIYTGMITWFILYYKSEADKIGANWIYSIAHILVWHLPLVFLPVSKNSFLLAILSIPFERAIKYHRWLARCCWGWMLIHLLTMLNLHGNNIILSTELTDYGVGTTYGFFAFICVSAMVLFAMEPIRRMKFELFWFTHLLIMPAVITLACLHNTWIRYFFIVPLILYVLDKILRYFNALGTYNITSIQLLADNISPVRVTRLTIQNRNFKYNAGQYAFINIPQISLFEWHPFSMTTDPNTTQTTGNITFHILDTRTEGEFTQKLAKLAEQFSPEMIVKNNNNNNMNDNQELSVNALSQRLLSDSGRSESSLKLRIHGGYGCLSVNIYDYTSLVFVGGGIGITPFFSILSELIHKSRINALKNVQCIYVLFTASTLNAFTGWYSELLAELLQNPAVFHCFFYANIPAQFQNIESPDSDALKVHRERMDLPNLFNKIDRLQQEQGFAEEIHPTAVLTCGPTKLIKQTQDLSKKRGYAFHKETFIL